MDTPHNQGDGSDERSTETPASEPAHRPTSDAPGVGDHSRCQAPGARIARGPEAPVPNLTIEDALGVIVIESGARYEDIDWPVAISSALGQAQRGGLDAYERVLEAVGVLVGIPHKHRVSLEMALATLWPENAIKNQIIGYLKGKASLARDEEANAPDLEAKRDLNSRATRFELAAVALEEE